MIAWLGWVVQDRPINQRAQEIGADSELPLKAKYGVGWVGSGWAEFNL